MAETGFLKLFLRLAMLASTLQLIEAVCYPTTCREALHRGNTTSGVYQIDPDAQGFPIELYCDQTTEGGGWIVFQRRQDGSVDFYRNWNDYKIGFGPLSGEFWLGNDKIHAILSEREQFELRVELEDFDGNRAYAKYSTFKVGSAVEQYVLTVDGYSGNASDVLQFHSGLMFSTKDKDNDIKSYESCAESSKGGWWYHDCHNTNLNGLYTTNRSSTAETNVGWQLWTGFEPLKFTEMKFREVYAQ